VNQGVKRVLKGWQICEFVVWLAIFNPLNPEKSTFQGAELIKKPNIDGFLVGGMVAWRRSSQVTFNAWTCIEHRFFDCQVHL